MEYKIHILKCISNKNMLKYVKYLLEILVFQILPIAAVWPKIRYDMLVLNAQSQAVRARLPNIFKIKISKRFELKRFINHRWEVLINIGGLKQKWYSNVTFFTVIFVVCIVLFYLISDIEDWSWFASHAACHIHIRCCSVSSRCACTWSVFVSGAFGVLFAKKRRRCQQNIVSLPLPGKEIDMP